MLLVVVNYDMMLIIKVDVLHFPAERMLKFSVFVKKVFDHFRELWWLNTLQVYSVY